MDQHIKTTALYQQVADRLRERIFNHEFASGAWIDEQQLVSDYGISRTPLREALKVLAAENLVTLVPRRGCYVREVSVQDLTEVFAVLSLLEAETAHLACVKMNPGNLAELEALHQQLIDAAKQGHVDRFFSSNQQFHAAVHEIANNRWLAASIQDLRKVVRLARHQSLRASGRIAQSLGEHELIMTSFRQGKADEARANTQAHLQNAQQTLLQMLGNNI